MLFRSARLDALERRAIAALPVTLSFNDEAAGARLIEPLLHDVAREGLRHG